MHISVLMSVYNESENEIKESIDSILRQTFTSFEFIIVNDNPQRGDLPLLLNYYNQLDSRIVILTNEYNIGLALSLNKAANIAKTDIFARMDADDISNPNRFALQYEVISKKSYDLVFSNYEFINEESSLIPWENSYIGYSTEDISRLLPYTSIIHHPTVMMTRDIFERTGGYRNFPCAQDQDLWLRMWEKGGRFYMIDHKLLKYRVRKNSVSKLKKLQQKLTVDYIQDLFLMRLKNGMDNYSEKNYNTYIINNCVNNVNKIAEMHKYTIILLKAQKLKKNKNYVLSTLLRARVLIFSSIFRKSYLKKFKIKYAIKKYRIKGSLNDNNRT